MVHTSAWFAENLGAIPNHAPSCLGMDMKLSRHWSYWMPTRTEHSKPINQQLPIASWIWRNVHHFSISFLNTSHAGCLGGTSAPTRSKKEHEIEFWTQPPTPFPSVKPQKTIFIYVHTCSRLSLGVKFCGCISIYEFVKTSIFDHFRYSSIARNWGLPQISDKPTNNYDEGWKIITMQSWICLTGPPQKNPSGLPKWWINHWENKKKKHFQSLII